MTRQQVTSFGRFCKHYKLPAVDQRYENKPQTVIENDDTTVPWDMPVNTDKEINDNRLDIIIENRQQKTSLMIDMTVPSERYVSIKEAGKNIKVQRSGN